MEYDYDEGREVSVYEQAYALLDAGQIDDAIALVKAEISHSPGNADLYVLLAGMYFDENRYEDAREYAHAAAALYPDGDAAYRLLAWIEFRQEHYAAAYKHANKALAIDPDSTDNIYIAAWSAYYRNKIKLAAVLVERGIEIDPENAKLHVLCGIIAFTQKKYDKFDQEFQTAIAVCRTPYGNRAILRGG